MKYELIKEYPGSPELGTEVEKDKLSKSYFYRCGDKRWVVLNDHVENNPEYWKKVDENVWWCVWKNDGFFKAWTPYRVECERNDLDKNRGYFKTKEEAKDFILFNKPCLSYNDISFHFPFNTESKDSDLHFKVNPDRLKSIIKNML